MPKQKPPIWMKTAERGPGQDRRIKADVSSRGCERSGILRNLPSRSGSGLARSTRQPRPFPHSSSEEENPGRNSAWK